MNSPDLGGWHFPLPSWYLCEHTNVSNYPIIKNVFKVILAYKSEHTNLCQNCQQWTVSVVYFTHGLLVMSLHDIT